MERYGFVGLGSQGAPMARRMIAAGLPVVLWARRRESLAPFAGSGAEFAESLAELGSRVHYCGVCVVDDAGVEAVCRELIATMAPGGRIVVHATASPALCRRLAVEAAERELELVDAPVTGGGPAAEAGRLAVLVGGHPAVVAAIRPVLETFAARIFHLGEVGAGQRAKLLNNALMAANLALAHLALEAAGDLGLDRAQFVELVRAGSGHSFAFDVAARIAEPTAFAHGARLLAKDLDLFAVELDVAQGRAAADARRLVETAGHFLQRALAPREAQP